jgi:hypothetical protein
VEKKIKNSTCNSSLALVSIIKREKKKSLYSRYKLVRELKKQLQINLRRRGRRRVWIKAAAAAATSYSAMNEKLAANWVTLERETD